MTETITTAMATYESNRPATALEIRRQVNLIQEVIRAVFKDGHHFGKIPGCGDKPTLLKPGAEKILATFRIAVNPEIEDISEEGNIAFRCKCIGTTPNGVIVGAGIGECSTDEDKYKWRGSMCEAEWESTDSSQRRIKYKRDGSFVQQIRTNPADLANTVLKMAKKRAEVDLCLTATACSDLFAQDVESLPEGIEMPETALTIKTPQSKSAQPQTLAAPAEPGSRDGDGQYVGLVKAVAIKSGKKKDGSTWTRFGVQCADDKWLNTFSETFGTIAQDAKKNQTQLVITYEETEKGINILEMAPV